MKYNNFTTIYLFMRQSKKDYLCFHAGCPSAVTSGEMTSECFFQRKAARFLILVFLKREEEKKLII